MIILYEDGNLEFVKSHKKFKKVWNERVGPYHNNGLKPTYVFHKILEISHLYSIMNPYRLNNIDTIRSTPIGITMQDQDLPIEDMILADISIKDNMIIFPYIEFIRGLNKFILNTWSFDKLWELIVINDRCIDDNINTSIGVYDIGDEIIYEYFVFEYNRWYGTSQPPIEFEYITIKLSDTNLFLSLSHFEYTIINDIYRVIISIKDGDEVSDEEISDQDTIINILTYLPTIILFENTINAETVEIDYSLDITIDIYFRTILSSPIYLPLSRYMNCTKNAPVDLITILCETVYSLCK